MAAGAGVSVAPHSFHDLHVHLVASAPNGIFVEYFPDGSILPFRRVIDRQLAVRNGELVLPPEPGLGFEFDQDAVDRFAVDPWEERPEIGREECRERVGPYE